MPGEDIVERSAKPVDFMPLQDHFIHFEPIWGQKLKFFHPSPLQKKQQHLTTYKQALNPQYRNGPKFSGRQVWKNSLDPDQTASRGGVWSMSTMFVFAIPVCIVTHYSMESPY